MIISPLLLLKVESISPLFEHFTKDATILFFVFPFSTYVSHRIIITAIPSLTFNLFVTSTTIYKIHYLVPTIVLLLLLNCLGFEGMAVHNLFVTST